MKEIKVEPLSLTDAAEIEALFKEVWPTAVEYPEEWRRKRTLGREEIVKEMKEGYHYFGVRAGDRIVALYKASIRGEIILGEHQSIRPAYRGRGLATAMYKQLIDFAKEKRCKRVYVNILLNQMASKKCVDELGFRKKGDLYEQAKGMTVQMYEKEIGFI